MLRHGTATDVLESASSDGEFTTKIWLGTYDKQDPGCCSHAPTSKEEGDAVLCSLPVRASRLDNDLIAT